MKFTDLQCSVLHNNTMLPQYERFVGGVQTMTKDSKSEQGGKEGESS